MGYCLCVKSDPKDKNLMHIVKSSHISKAVYRSYKVVFTTADESLAFDLAAQLVQDFVDKYGYINAADFKTWIMEAESRSGAYEK